MSNLRQPRVCTVEKKFYQFQLFCWHVAIIISIVLAAVRNLKKKDTKSQQTKNRTIINVRFLFLTIGVAKCKYIAICFLYITTSSRFLTPIRWKNKTGWMSNYNDESAFSCILWRLAKNSAIVREFPDLELASVVMTSVADCKENQRIILGSCQRI